MNKAAETQTAGAFSIGAPKLLTPKAVLKLSAYGLVLIVPFLASVLMVSVLRLGVWTYAIPLATIVAATFFLPIGFGNPYVNRLIQPLRPAAAKADETFAVQLSLSPRLHSGLRALIEDADDFGWLTVTESTLEYRGDSVTFSLPWSRVRQARRQNVEWRSVFLYGPRVVLLVTGIPNVTAIEFAERSSCLLPGSRQAARRLREAILRSLSLSSS